MVLLKRFILWLRTKKRREDVYVLAELNGTDDIKHYRWVRLGTFGKELMRMQIDGRAIPLRQVAWMQECSVTGCSHNLLKIRLKTGEFCHVKLRAALGNLLTKSQQVFKRDGNLNWSSVRVVKFLPVGKRFIYDHRGYELARNKRNLVVRRYYPHSEEY